MKSINAHSFKVILLFFFSKFMLKSHMEDTKSQYHQIISKSRKIFIDKNTDYGSSWRVLRIISLVDQINIKAQRIRNLQNNINNKIAEGQTAEFYGIINYSIMGLIQLEKGVVDEPDRYLWWKWIRGRAHRARSCHPRP